MSPHDIPCEIHPLHTILIHVPIGLCLGSLGSDLLALWHISAKWWAAGEWMLELGLLPSAPAALVGLVDYLATMEDRAEEPGGTANAHVFAALIGIGLLVASNERRSLCALSVGRGVGRSRGRNGAGSCAPLQLPLPPLTRGQT